MIFTLQVGATGKRPGPFTHPDQPKPIPVGKCGECGGNTRAEDFTSWMATTGHVHKRIYRCIRNPWKCPTVTETINEETPMPKAIIISQTPEWCSKIKGAAKRKSLRYAQLGEMIGVTEDAIRSYLNRKTDMPDKLQESLAYAIGKHVSEYVGEKLACNLRLAIQDLNKAMGVDRLRSAMCESGANVTHKMIEDAVAGKAQAETALNAVEIGLMFLEKYPPPGVFTGTTQCRGVLNPELPPAIVSADSVLGKAADHIIACAREDAEAYVAMLQVQPGPDGLGFETEMEERMRDLEQRHKALECKVAGVAERAEERITGLAGELSNLNYRVDELDLGQSQARKHVDATYERLTEHMANLQPLVIGQRAEHEDVLDEWLATRPAIHVHKERLEPEALLAQLAYLTEAQVQALVTAAAARRNFFKALEAA